MAKIFGYAAVLQVTTTTGDLAIGQLRSMSGPGVDFGDVDTTCMDSSSNYRTFVLVWEILANSHLALLTTAPACPIPNSAG